MASSSQPPAQPPPAQPPAAQPAAAQPPPSSIHTQTYKTKQEITQAIRTHYLKVHNTRLSIRKSSESVVEFKCYFGGTYRNKLKLNDDTRRKRTTSRLLECPFRVVVRSSWNYSNSSKKSKSSRNMTPVTEFQSSSPSEQQRERVWKVDLFSTIEEHRNHQVEDTKLPMSEEAKSIVASMAIGTTRSHAHPKEGGHGFIPPTGKKWSAKQILSALQQRGLADGISIKDVQNRVLTMRAAAGIKKGEDGLANGRHMNGGRTDSPTDVIQELEEGLKRKNYYVAISRSTSEEHDSEGTSIVNAILFAHPQAVTMARRFRTVFTLDSMKRTNKHDLQLWCFVGVLNTSKVFCAAYCLMPLEETEVSYTSMLRLFKELLGGNGPGCLITDKHPGLLTALSQVMPTTHNLICAKYVSNAVATECKTERCMPGITDKEFKAFMQLWNKFMDAGTEEEYREKWAALVRSCDAFPNVLRNLTDVWMPLETKFVRVFTSNIMHCGIRHVVRIESYPGNTRGFLTPGSVDLLTLSENLEQVWLEQFREFRDKERYDRTRIINSCRQDIFANLVGKISHYALRHIQLEYQHREEQSPCVDNFATTMGLPCRHEIKQLSISKSRIPLSCVHPQWRLRLEKDLLSSSVETEYVPITVFSTPVKAPPASAWTSPRPISIGNILEAARPDHMKEHDRSRMVMDHPSAEPLPASGQTRADAAVMYDLMESNLFEMVPPQARVGSSRPAAEGSSFEPVEPNSKLYRM